MIGGRSSGIGMMMDILKNGLSLCALLVFSTSCVVSGVDECSETLDSCGGESICVVDQCLDAFGRVYVLSNLYVELPARNSVGDDWDAGGGAPDPFFTVQLNGEEVLTTTAAPNTFSASFSDTANVVIPAGSTFELIVADEDLAIPDPGFTCIADPLTANLLRGRVLTCENSGWVVTAQLDPR